MVTNHQKIHFVCEGNTFRSRLAEAYLKSIKPELQVSSSGIKASKNYNGPITIYSKKIANDEHINKYLAPTWTQSTKNIIEEADLVIFMKKEYYTFCVNDLNCIIKNYQVWNILDVFDYPNHHFKNKAEKIELYMKNALLSYKKLKQKINTLIIKETS